MRAWLLPGCMMLAAWTLPSLASGSAWTQTRAFECTTTRPHAHLIYCRLCFMSTVKTASSSPHTEACKALPSSTRQITWSRCRWSHVTHTPCTVGTAVVDTRPHAALSSPAACASAPVALALVRGHVLEHLAEQEQRRLCADTVDSWRTHSSALCASCANTC